MLFIPSILMNWPSCVAGKLGPGRRDQLSVNLYGIAYFLVIAV